MQYNERIRALREDSDLSQTDVAKIINVSQRTYSDYENGVVRMPIDCLMRLAKYYNVSMDYILCASDILQEYPKK